ncbi:MAG TPA: hypothetical protein DCX04_11375 [Halomonas sp.]|nr:hypothetical protein [Halomonas sp.]
MSWDNLIPVAGMIASIIAAAAVARHQIRKLELDSDKSSKRLDAQDIRLDKLTTITEILDRRTDVIAKINSPENLEARTQAIERIRTDVEWIKRKMEK